MFPSDGTHLLLPWWFTKLKMTVSGVGKLTNIFWSHDSVITSYRCLLLTWQCVCTVCHNSTRGQQWAQSHRIQLWFWILKSSAKKHIYSSTNRLGNKTWLFHLVILTAVNWIEQPSNSFLLWPTCLTFDLSNSTTFKLTCCQQKVTEIQLVWTNGIKIFKCGIDLHCSSWLWITIYKLTEFLNSHTTVHAEHLHPPSLSVYLPACLSSSSYYVSCCSLGRGSE